jgi:predicted nucleotide-binding protein (sugar kinase/HSP70/actin superfamily)
MNHLDSLDQVRDRLIEQHAEHDEVGNIIQEQNEQGQQVITLKSTDAFKRDIDELMNQTFDLPTNTDENKVMMNVVKNAVLNVERTFSGSEAMQYDDFCELVEQM